ncbi:1,4-alpha-glucan branching protein GlgB [Listeria booriae]|nr:1,4-alpha-glucan branching enzyme GlgB [Listeria booriae]
MLCFLKTSSECGRGVINFGRQNRQTIQKGCDEVSNKLLIGNMSEADTYLFNNGSHFQSYQLMGCQFATDRDGNEGFSFRVWAPNAKGIAIVGDFCNWDTGFSLTLLGETGIWEGFSTDAKPGQHYKILVEDAKGNRKLKMDPYAFAFELRPKDAAVVTKLPDFKWTDGRWMAKRKRRSVYEAPLNIYEVHAGSWRKPKGGGEQEFYNFAELAELLIPYVAEMGYTHIEFMPLMEHPLDASWGYQITGYYALSARYGTLEEFMGFVDACHAANIGVIMDWVPGHFCRNDNALAYFDGTPQFEYWKSFQADNVRWGTLNFDLSKGEVHSFLISNALFWIEMCHLDGLRVDAVSNMIYLDYDDGYWEANEDGNNLNKAGIDFVQKLNTEVFRRYPDMLMVAEESTAYPNVTKPVDTNGLGFNYKWNMGWMNDILKFFEMDPLFRKDHFNLVTFSFMYMFKENYILALSHDEVVHGKKSMMHKMPGDRYNQFAGLRTLEAFLMTHPGKKLNFMGNETGQFLEWKFAEELEWTDLNQDLNHQYQFFVRTLNELYVSHKALFEQDHQPEGMDILDADNRDESILTFIRQGVKPRDFLVVACNFVPVERQRVRIGVPYEGIYEELLNTEAREFGGTWDFAQPEMKTSTEGHNGLPYSIEVILPAMSVLIIKPKRIKGYHKGR